jgi:hypothetical protein
MSLLRRVLECHGEKRSDVRVVERVIRDLAILSVSHQAHLAEGAKGVRYRGLRRTDDEGKVAYAELMARERIDDPEASRVSEHAKRISDNCDVLR